MTIKSVIDIEVNDAQFARFSSLFDKYQEALGKTPSAWANAGKEQAAMASQFEKMTAAMLAQSQWHRELANAQRMQVAHLGTMARLWNGIAGSTKGAAHHIKSVTGALLHWGKILGGVSGLLGAGGLWGISRMASEAGEQRQAAGGVGMSIGQRQAFITNMWQFLGGRSGASSFASNVVAAQETPSRRAAFSMLGIHNPGAFSSLQLANETVKGLWRFAHQHKTGNLGLWANTISGYGLPTNVQTLRYLKGIPYSNIQKQIAAQPKDIKSFAVSGGVAEQWMQFTTQMHRAGHTIWSTFVRDLTPLEQPLEKLSKGFTKLVDEIMKGKGLKAGIQELGKGINWLGDEFKSGDFQKEVDRFVRETPHWIKSMGHSLDQIDKALGGAGNFFSKTSAAAHHPFKAAGHIVEQGIKGDIDLVGKGIEHTGLWLSKYLPSWLGGHPGPYPTHTVDINKLAKRFRRDYNGVNVKIENNTGGSVNTSVNQLTR